MRAFYTSLRQTRVRLWRAKGHWSTMLGLSTPWFDLQISLLAPREPHATYYGTGFRL